MATAITDPAQPVPAPTGPPGVAAWREGARDVLPVLVGIVPFGLAVGHAMGSSMSPDAAVASSVLVFAGSAQLTIAQMVGDGAAVIAVVGSVVLVNARLVLFGGAMAPQWTDASARFRAAAAYLLTDPVFALGLARGERPGTPAERRAYYIGAALDAVGGVAGGRGGRAAARRRAAAQGAPRLRGATVPGRGAGAGRVHEHDASGGARCGRRGIRRRLAPRRPRPPRGDGRRHRGRARRRARKGGPAPCPNGRPARMPGSAGAVMNVWIIVVAAGAATFALRIALVAVFARVAVPEPVQLVLRLAAPASMAALTAVAIGASGSGSGSVSAPAIVPWAALAVAVVVAQRTKSVAITVATGLAVFSLLSAAVS